MGQISPASYHQLHLEASQTWKTRVDSVKESMQVDITCSIQKFMETVANNNCSKVQKVEK